jgi:hypothetical protein
MQQLTRAGSGEEEADEEEDGDDANDLVDADALADAKDARVTEASDVFRRSRRRGTDHGFEGGTGRRLDNASTTRWESLRLHASCFNFAIPLSPVGL